MNKHLELVESSFTQEHFNKQTSQNPYVAYSIEDGKVIYSIIGGNEPDVDVDLTSPYIMFKAQEDNSTIGLEKLSTGQTMEYSTNTITWNTLDTTTNISLNNGDKVYVRGILSLDNDVNNFTQFEMSGKIAVYGNCNALWNYEDLEAPLKAYCGNRLFFNCSALTTAPVLPATTLAKGCYIDMFVSCKSLTVAPELPATTLSPYCYDSMFYSCSALTTAPELPATELADNCYLKMFYNCTSLTTTPELPATTLASSCYKDMFYNCTSLTTVPELPATTLVTNCYYRMFHDCTSLSYIKCLAAGAYDQLNTNFWVNNVSPTGTFVKHPNMSKWPRGVHGIPEGWIVEDAEL